MSLLPSLTLNRIFVFMRAWFGCIFILFVSTVCSASPAFAGSAKTWPSVKSEVVQTSAIEHHGRNHHCDQLEDTELITAAYTQYNTFGPLILTVYHGLKTVIYPVANTAFRPGRHNALIQPFYKLILFPFHVFW